MPPRITTVRQMANILAAWGGPLAYMGHWLVDYIKGTNMDNDDQGSTGRDAGWEKNARAGTWIKNARAGAWVVMQPHDLRSGACVSRRTYLFRNFFRAAMFYANFHLCSVKINAPQQLRMWKKSDCRDSTGST